MDPIDIDVRWLMAPLTSEGGYQFTISLDLLAISDSYQESHDQCLQSSDANGGFLCNVRWDWDLQKVLRQPQ